MRISPIKYAQALAQTLEENNNASEVVQGFMRMLARKKQTKLLGKILKAFEVEWFKRKGIAKLSVDYPEKFANSVGEFEKAIAQKLGKNIQMSSKPSKTMIGGLRVLVGDTLIDSSVETRLKNLALKLNS